MARKKEDRDPRKVAIGSRIKLAREEQGLKQHHLAEHVGVTVSAVGQWEIGHTLPEMENFDRLPSILGVSREWLLTGNDADETGRAQTEGELLVLRLARHLSEAQQKDLIKSLSGVTGIDPRDLAKPNGK